MNTTLLKKISGISKDLYESARLYKNKSGFKLKFYNTESVDLDEIKKNYTSSDECFDYKIDVYKDSSDLVVELVPMERKYGLVQIESNLNEQIKEAAYYLAEQRNFEPGFELADWLLAKQQVYGDLE